MLASSIIVLANVLLNKENTLCLIDDINKTLNGKKLKKVIILMFSKIHAFNHPKIRN